MGFKKGALTIQNLEKNAKFFFPQVIFGQFSKNKKNSFNASL